METINFRKWGLLLLAIMFVCTIGCTTDDLDEEQLVATPENIVSPEDGENHR